MTRLNPKYQYDPSVDALVVTLRSDEITRTIEVDEQRLVDLNESDEVVEIEVLWASTGVDFSDLIDRFGLADVKPFLDEVASATFQPE